MTKHYKPQHLKRAQFSLSLPAWHRALFSTIDGKSSSRAAAKLIHYALKHGALAELAPGMPSALLEPSDVAAYLTGQPNYISAGAATRSAQPPVAVTPPTQQAPRPPMTPEQVAAFFDEDGEPDPTPVAPQPIQRQQPRLYTDAELKQLQQEAEAQARAMHLGGQQ